MLTLIPDLPATAVGVRAHEQVTGDDFENVLIPAVEAAEAASSHGKVRMRIAVVGEAQWLQRAIHALSRAMPGEVRAFASDDLDEARAWVTS